MASTIPLLGVKKRHGTAGEPEPPIGDPVEPRIQLPAVPLSGFVPKVPSHEELQLVQRIFFLSGDKNPQIIVFCGVEAGDGSETVCARTAEVLSLLSQPVCVMDANLRAPTLHLRYEIDEAGTPFGGRAPKLVDDGTALDSSLWVLPAGALRECSPGFAPESVKRRLSLLREKFRFLLIAAPPLSTAAEGFLLGQMADGVVLTVMARSTQRAAALKARRNLESYNVRLLGTVLSEPPARAWLARARNGNLETV